MGSWGWGGGLISRPGLCWWRGPRLLRLGLGCLLCSGLCWLWAGCWLCWVWWWGLMLPAAAAR